MSAQMDRTLWHLGPPKLRRNFVTPEGVSLNISIATAGARVGALALDLGVMLAAIIVLFIGLFLLEQAMPGLLDNSGFGQFLVVLVIIFLFLLRNAYFLYFELGVRNATWGKRMVGIRVAARDGGRLTAEAIIARNILRDVELFLPLMFMIVATAQGNLTEATSIAGFTWLGVFLLFPLCNRDRLRCGDLLAGTWVVLAQQAKLGAVVAPQASATAKSARSGVAYRFSDDELSVYGEYELQTLEGVLRSDNAASLEAVCAAICTKIGWNPGAGDERAFLEAYYTQLRAKLESNMRFGKRRADKFSGEG